MKPPTPHQIRSVRLALGLTQAEAAAWVHVTPRAWQWWESGERQMPLASWELCVVKAGLHPVYGERGRAGSAPLGRPQGA